MAEYKIVNSSELGSCLSPHRFCGGRCSRVYKCKYPEKVTCKAVQAEIVYQIDRTEQQLERTRLRSNELISSLYKRIYNLNKEVINGSDI